MGPTHCPTLALTSLATVPALWSQETIPGSQLVSLPARPFPGFLALALPAWKGQDSGSVPALFLLCLPLWPGLSPCLGPQLEVSLPCFCALVRDPFPAGMLVPPLGCILGPPGLQMLQLHLQVLALLCLLVQRPLQLTCLVVGLIQLGGERGQQLGLGQPGLPTA